MALKIDITSETPRKHLIALDGWLDGRTYEECERRLAPLLTAPGAAPVLIFDLAKLAYISSMGLRLILKLRKLLEGRGGCVLMTNLQPQIARVFEIASALPPGRIFTSVAEADRYFDAMQKQALGE